MAIVDRNTLKSYFKTGVYPTEEQFAILIDSLRHQSDEVAMSLITGLADALNNKASKDAEVKIAEVLKAIEEGTIGGGYTVDQTNNLLIVTASDDAKTQYACAVSEYTKPAKPTASAGGSDTDASRTVSFACATSGATIQYQLDGGSWTNGTSVKVTASTSSATTSNTIKVRATKNGLTSDELTITVATARHLSAPTITVETDGTVTLSQSDSATMYYTTDGSTPTTSSTKYSSAFTLEASATVKVLAVLDDWQNTTTSNTAYMMRYGVLSSAPTTEDAIKALTASTKDSAFPRSLTYASSGVAKAVIAYDSSLADLSSILEVASGYDRLSVWTKSTVGNYKVYTQNTAVDNNGVEFKFS